MRKLTLMRHAKSDWEHAGLADHDRPLNPRGQRAAPKMAEWMESTLGIPDLILASSAVRVQQTIEQLVGCWSDSPDVLTTEMLYLATPDAIKNIIGSDALDSEHLLVVAHNPGIQMLACELSGEYLEFPTAAVASFELDLPQWSNRFGPDQCALVGYMKPKQLDNA